MNRQTCLIVLVTQAILAVFLASIASLGSIAGLSRESAEYSFTLIALAFVVISPFGILSFFLSAGFWLMRRGKILQRGMGRLYESNSPIMFFVWTELRERSTEGDQ